MKAIVFYEHGGSDKLQYVEDLPKPEIEADEVLIQVKAAALNHLDIFTREGIPGLRLKMPHVPGSDIAGEIAEIGTQVKKWNVGDRVVINPGYWCGVCEFCKQGEHSLCKRFRIIGEHLQGGYAEFARIPTRNLLKLPDHVSYDKAAAASLAGLTAWRMIVTQGKVWVGDIVLVLGAGGGVANFAIQIAKLAGATVLATTSTEEKIQQAKAIGADYVINYKTDPEWWKTVFQITKKRGVDMVVDNVGAATWEHSIRILRKGGRLVTCGATTGPFGKTDIRQIFWKQITIIGSTMANHSEFEKYMDLVFNGKIMVPVNKVFRLQDAAKAQQYLEEREQFGKIILLIE